MHFPSPTVTAAKMGRTQCRREKKSATNGKINSNNNPNFVCLLKRFSWNKSFFFLLTLSPFVYFSIHLRLPNTSFGTCFIIETITVCYSKNFFHHFFFFLYQKLSPFFVLWTKGCIIKKLWKLNWPCWKFYTSISCFFIGPSCFALSHNMNMNF